MIILNLNPTGLFILLGIWAWVIAALPAEISNQTTPNTQAPFDFLIDGFRVQGYSDTSQFFQGTSAFFALDDMAYQLQASQSRRGPSPGFQRLSYTNDARGVIKYPRVTTLLSFSLVCRILRQMRIRLETEQFRTFHPIQATVTLDYVLKLNIELEKIPVQHFAVNHGRWHSICNYYPTRRITPLYVQTVIERFRTWLTASGHVPAALIPQINLPEFSIGQTVLDIDFDPEGQSHWTRITYGEMTVLLNLIVGNLEGPPSRWCVFDCLITTEPHGGLTAGRISMTNAYLGEEEGGGGTEELHSSPAASQDAASATPFTAISL
ncbi:MAG: hypothetical protein Q9167_006858 [Letrouitia subvulpina]